MQKAELRRIPLPLGAGVVEIPLPKDARILDILEPMKTLNAGLLVYWPWDQPADEKRLFTVLPAGLPFEDPVTGVTPFPVSHLKEKYLGRYRSKNSDFFVLSGEWR